jgi:hypothetical protein
LRHLGLTRAEAREAVDLAYPIGDNPAGTSDFAVGQTVRLVGESWWGNEYEMGGEIVTIEGRDGEGPTFTHSGKLWVIYNDDTDDYSAELVTGKEKEE